MLDRQAWLITRIYRFKLSSPSFVSMITQWYTKRTKHSCLHRVSFILWVLKFCTKIQPIKSICFIDCYQPVVINPQYFNTLVYPFLFKTGLIPASTLLDYCQRLYTYWLLSLLDKHPTKQILIINLRIENKSFQSIKLFNNIFI